MAGAESPLAQLRALLAAQSAGDDVAGLIAEARAEARARVRSLLVDAFSEALLAEVHGALRAPAPEPPAQAPAPEPPAQAPAPEPPAQAPAPETPAQAPAPEPAAQAPDPPPPDPAPARAAERAPSLPRGLGWYVYCIVEGDLDVPPADLSGVSAAHPAFGIRHGDLTAVVSHVPLSEFGEEPLRERLADMEWLERTARAHEHVLETVARVTTPIPMRLCTIYRDERGVRDMLQREHDALRDALAHLAGKEEWGVKAFAARPADDQPPADDQSQTGDSSPADAPGASDGAAYMQRRLAERRQRDELDHHLQEACAQVHEALAATALDAVTLSPHRPEMTGRRAPMVLNTSYLVAHEHRMAFHRAFDELAQSTAAMGLELELTGPWPPYNFVPGTIGAAW